MSGNQFVVETATPPTFEQSAGGPVQVVEVYIAGAKGEPGEPGAPGAPGPAGDLVFLGNYDSTVQYAVNETVFYQGSSYHCYQVPPVGTVPTNTAYWQIVAQKGDAGPDGANGANGANGAPGSVWRNGSGAPSNATGVDGDYYLDTAAGDVYKRIAGAYVLQGNIKGAAGADGANGANGANGSVWRSGSGAPGNALGVDGDYYLDAVSGDIYKRLSGAYSLQANIKGAPGTAGTAGANGADGAPGSVWRSGSGVPANGLGVNNDYYLNTANGDVYAKAGGAYALQGNIKGATGNTGSTGAPGSVWRSGAGVPSNATGIDGDYYLNTANGDTYAKAAGAYTLQGNIKGATGAAGANGSNGANGSVWRNGSGAPSNATGVDGDYYLNTANGDVYLRSSGTYAVVANIKGATGAAGADGSAFVGGTLTGALIGSDQVWSRAMQKDMGNVWVDKGNSGTTTQTIDYSAGSHQQITVTGNHTIAFSNWPPTGNTGYLQLDLVNGNAFTVTWPTINWEKPDGTFTTSIATYLAANTGRTALQTSGTDSFVFWSRDGGTTVYGKLI